MARVDVMMPAYNAEHVIGEAIDSVLQQTYSDWRIVVVDDGSTDGTAEILYRRQDRLKDKLLSIRQQNQGVSAARNTVLEHSNAEFIALLDADDRWLPRRLQTAIEVLDAAPSVGLTHGRVRRIDAGGTSICEAGTKASGPAGSVTAGLYRRRVHLLSPTITLRRSCTQDCGRFDTSLRSTEDRDMWLRISERYGIRFINEVVAEYRTSPHSLTKDPSGMFAGQMKFIEKHYGKHGCGPLARRDAQSSAFREKADALYTTGRTDEALSAYAHALGLTPWRIQHLYMVAKSLASQKG